MEEKNNMRWGERSILQTSEGPGFSAPNGKGGQAGKPKWKKEKGKGS